MHFNNIFIFFCALCGAKRGPNRIKFGNDFVWRRYRKLTDSNSRLESELDTLQHRVAQLEQRQQEMQREGMLQDEAIYTVNQTVNRTRSTSIYHTFIPIIKTMNFSDEFCVFYF